MSFTPISDIGRQALIERIRSICVKESDQTLIGIGDDAALYLTDPGYSSLISTETLVEGIDFDLTFHPLSHLGFKVVTSGVSDILAMGGVPKQLLISLNVTTKVSVEMVEEFYRGVKEACSFYQCDLVGGDLRSSRGAIVLSVTATGLIKSGSVSTRRTAKTGDAICVTGSLGEALAGLKILLRERKFWEDNPEASQPELDVWKEVVSKQLIPRARIDIVRLMNDHHIRPNAMIDLSKGFLNELKELCSQSHVGAYVYEAALPITDQTKDVASEMGELASAYALQGGEDFELMFTLPEEAVEKAFEILKDITVVGMIRPASEGIQIQKFTGEVWEIDSDQ
jgi:thiamine-monophosphate kinase